MPAWRALAEIASALLPKGEELPADAPWKILAEEHEALACFGPENYPVDGVRIIPEEIPAALYRSHTSADSREERPGNSVELLMVEWLYGTEELSAHSPIVQPMVRDPFLVLNEADAGRAGLSDGNAVRISLEDGSLELVLRVSPESAPGTAILPRHQRLEWQKLKRVPTMISLDRIEKI